MYLSRKPFPKVRKIVLFSKISLHMCIISISGFINVPHKKDANYWYFSIGSAILVCYTLKPMYFFWDFSFFTLVDLPVSLNSYSFILNFDNFVRHVQSSPFFFFTLLFSLVILHFRISLMGSKKNPLGYCIGLS